MYICGGFNGNECLFTAESYSPQTNQWTLTAPMRSRRSGVGVIAYAEQVYAVSRTFICSTCTMHFDALFSKS